jgi:hypothetical protein
LNNCHMIHCNSPPFLLVGEKRFERLLDHNDCGTKSDDKQ